MIAFWRITGGWIRCGVDAFRRGRYDVDRRVVAVPCHSIVVAVVDFLYYAINRGGVNMSTRLAVLTSGGDAPGMNAAIRAVVRHGIYQGYTVFGVREGYKGLCENPDISIVSLETKDVCRILGSGGTFLCSARFPQFEDEEIRKRTLRNLKARRISDLVVIGGDGSFRGANALSDTNAKYEINNNLHIVCIPASIDNDIPKTKASIGADTALNTAIDCVDKIRDTAYSHKRVFVVQVMGRDCDYIPIMVGISTGADVVIKPQDSIDISGLVDEVKSAFIGGKDFFVVIVAEGLRKIVIGKMGGEEIRINNDDYSRYTAAEILAKELNDALSIDEEYKGRVRPVILGHVQRGGSPTEQDRRLATRLAVEAIDVLQKWPENNPSSLMVAIQNDGDIGEKTVRIPLDEVLNAREEDGPPSTGEDLAKLGNKVKRVF